MCGIFGVLYRNTATVPNSDTLESIARTLQHRGPDHYGIYADAGIGLVHTRLSLLDLHPRSNQPFWDRKGRSCLVYNGEIYNFQELGKQLQEKGVALRTSSDTEVLLESLLHHETHEILPEFEGMFAFGLFGTHDKSLTIARDRFGIKPLYVYDTEDLFIFSSEIKAIAQYVKLEPDLLSISSFLQGFGGPTNNHTFFRNIKFLSPGTIVRVRPGQPASYQAFFRIPDFWDRTEADDLKRLPVETIVNKTEELLFTSVKKHLIADAPVGGLCSGGVDSSLIMAMASKIHNNLAIFHANVVGPNSEYDSALLLSKHLKLDLKSVDVCEDDFVDTIPDVAEHYEHPFCYHPSSVPFLKVSRLIRENGVKAILSGEGSDECYLGYDFVVNDHPLLFYRKIPYYIQTLLQKIPKLRAIIPPSDDHTRDLLLHLHNRFEILLDNELIRSRVAESTKTLGPIGSLNLLNYHLRTLLHRNDCLGMAASVEARFPFLDHELVRLAVNMPYAAKIRFAPALNTSHRFLRDKWVIRRIARRYLPPGLSQRQKSGFRFDGFERMQVSPSYFSDSPIADMLGLSASAMRILLEKAPRDLTLKLFHLDMWSHICLYRLSKDRLLNRLKQHVKMAPLTTIAA